MKVSIRINGEEHALLTWETGQVAANENRIGPTVNWVLPDVDATELTLCLSAGDASSEYRLCYRRSAENAISRQMNV